MPSVDPQQVRRILAVRLDNIGDVVMLSPALRSLQSAMPQAEITLLASPAGSQVAPMLPWVKDVMVLRSVWQDVSGDLPFDPQRELRLIDELRSRRFDAAWIFTSFTQSPYPPAYLCYLAGIPVRVGHSKEFGGQVLSISAKAPADSGHQVDRNLALVELAGLPVAGRQLELHVPPAAQERADALLQAAGINPQAPFLLLAPGASCAARRYPPERFADLLRALAAQSNLPMVVIGSERERTTLAPILQAAEELTQSGRPSIAALIGQTSVPELAALVRRSALVVANNSASLHLADAFNRPMVILYSGTEYVSQWEPRVSPARLLRRETHCSPCYAFLCPYAMECLDIPPEEVADQVLQLLAETAQSAGVLHGS